MDSPLMSIRQALLTSLSRIASASARSNGKRTPADPIIKMTIIHLILTIFATVVVTAQTWRHSAELLRTYVNEKEDLRLTLSGSSYTLEEGSPLTLPKAKREVDFENGSIVSFHDGILILRCSTVFHSPNRNSITLSTMGRSRDGFGNGPEADLNRRKMWEELPYRTSVDHTRRTLKLIHQGGRPIVTFEGVTLKAVPKGK